jgi:hypothetical protein
MTEPTTGQEHPDLAAIAIRALGPAPRCEPRNAGPDHPVHELLAALQSGMPHPDPVGLIRRYYDSIHELCCPYDHTEPRPGYAAAANRAALAEPMNPGPVIGAESQVDADRLTSQDGEPICTCTYGERCYLCRD